MGGAVKYLFLAYGDKRQWEAMFEAERGALTSDCAANDEALRLLGYLRDVQRLERGRAVIVRVHHGKVSFAESSLAQGREQLRGAFTISARDLNEAIQLATTMPQARGGPIEVRPLSEIER